MSNSITNSSKETRLAPEPLTTCPKCTYALTGLPSAHRCPECGFEYDAYSWAWLTSAKKIRRARMWSVLWLFFLICVASLMLADPPSPTGWFLNAKLAGIITILLPITTLIQAFVTIRRLVVFDPQSLIAVCPAGIIIYGSFNVFQVGKGEMKLQDNCKIIAWTDFQDIFVVGTMFVEYRLTCVNEAWLNTRQFVQDKAELDILRRALLDAKAHYLSLEQANKQ